MIVIKRNKQQENFNIDKIINAVKKAYKSCNKSISQYVIDTICITFKDYDSKEGTIHIEDIQDKVELILVNTCFEVAKSYIKYREQHKQTRFLRERLDYMKEYSDSDENASTLSETDANSNVTVKNIANEESEVFKTTNRRLQRLRMKDKLNELYPEVAKKYEEDLEDHIIYTHDESQTPSLKAYCMACTLYPMMFEGVGNMDKVTPSAPNDIQSFSGQVVNLLFLLSSQVKGAVALGDYIVALNYYVTMEFGENWYNKLNVRTNNSHSSKVKTIESEIRKGMKHFIYGVNQPAGNRSYNSPFSNLNFFDKYYYEALFEYFYYPDGTKPKWEAIDCLQRIFMKLLRQLRLTKPFTFPVTTICMLHDGNDCLDKDCKKWASEEWAKGSSFFLYLSNNPNSISSCCRVQNEIRENTFSSTTGLTGIMTGSANVITLNLNRIVQQCFRNNNIKKEEWFENKQLITEYLTNILERVYKYHIAYKTMLYDKESKKMYASSNANYIRIKKLYCTIGVIGYCEAAQFLGLDISNNKEYKEFLKIIFECIQEQNKKHSIYDTKKPFIFNTEAIPGENLAVKLYEWDKKDGYIVPENQNLYSSYFFKPWDDKISVLDKLKLHNKEVNQFLGGGQACHINLMEHLSENQYSKIIDLAVQEGCNYFTFNIPISECKDCGHIVNSPIKECPKCKSKNIDWWTRIIGFLRPISTWSKARQIEADYRIYNNSTDI